MMRSPPLFALSMLAALLVAGCSAGSGAKDQTAEAALLLPVDLVLMPVGDERADRFEDVELNRYVREAAIRVLARKGYQAIPRDAVAHEGQAAARELDEMTGAELAALGPDGASALLFLAITRAEHSYTYGGEDYAVTLSGVVVIPSTRSIVWRDSGSGRTSLGGLLRIFSPRSPAYDAIYQALQHLFHDVPKRTT